MKRVTLLLGFLLLAAPALAQTPTLVRQCVGTAAGCAPVSASAPLPVTPSAPTGTQDVNVKQVQGAVPSVTNPLWFVETPSTASGAGLAAVSSASLSANTVIKAGAGNLYSFEVSADSTLSAAAWWIMIYNATSAPVDGAVTPLKCYAMALGSTSFAAAFRVPVAFSTGITIGVSTTGCFTKTASTHAFISGDAQ